MVSGADLKYIKIGGSGQNVCLVENIFDNAPSSNYATGFATNCVLGQINALNIRYTFQSSKRWIIWPALHSLLNY